MIDICATAAISGELDLSTLKSFAEPGDGNLVNELIDLYLVEAEKSIGLIKTAAAKDDATLRNRAAHTLKGSSASLGFNQIAELCKRIEMNSREVNNSETLIGLLQLRFAEVRAALLEVKHGGIPRSRACRT